MQSNENYNDNISIICDRIRFAIAVSEQLTDEQKEHIRACADCRTFYEQSNKMSEHLASLRADFGRKELGVADSVMKEINSQKLFTFGAPFKNRHIFKHAGLVAACLVIVVMAIPLMNANMEKGADAAMENQSTMLEDSVTYGVYDEVYDYEIADVSDKSSYNLYNIVTTADDTLSFSKKASGSTLNGAFEEDLRVQNGVVYDTFDGAETEEVLPEASLSYDAKLQKEDLISPEITLAISDLASAHGFDVSSASVDYITNEFVQINFSDNAAQTQFIIQLELINGKWSVVYSGDIQNSIK